MLYKHLPKKPPKNEQNIAINTEKKSWKCFSVQIFDAFAFSIATACAGCGIATSDLICCQQKYDFHIRLTMLKSLPHIVIKYSKFICKFSNLHAHFY